MATGTTRFFQLSAVPNPISYYLTVPKIDDPQALSLIKDHECRDLGEAKICIDVAKNAIYSLYPIRLVERGLGYLLKVRVLPRSETEPPLLRPLVILLLGFVLSFSIIAIWISSFLKRHVRDPLLNHRNTLIPVLENKATAPFPIFEVSEVQDIAAQVEKLVREFESRKESEPVVNAVQMFAHDAVRPVNLMKTGLELLVAERSPERMREGEEHAVGSVFGKRGAGESVASSHAAAYRPGDFRVFDPGRLQGKRADGKSQDEADPEARAW